MAPTKVARPTKRGNRRKTKHTHLLPYPDFPLSPHVPTGRWYKVIKGRRVYFGKLADWQSAIDTYQQQREDLYAGRTRRSIDAQGIRLGVLCNRFLTAKQAAVDAHELNQRTYADYRTTTDRLVGTFGAHRLVADLRADDFVAPRAKLADRYGPTRLSNEIQRARCVFKFAWGNDLIEKRSSSTVCSSDRRGVCCGWPAKPSLRGCLPPRKSAA
ncbi:MAG: hypothetical protein WD042_11930 [Phycisphaeraceae bacterium]